MLIHRWIFLSLIILHILLFMYYHIYIVVLRMFSLLFVKLFFVELYRISLNEYCNFYILIINFIYIIIYWFFIYRYFLLGITSSYIFISSILDIIVNDIHQIYKHPLHKKVHVK